MSSPATVRLMGLMVIVGMVAGCGEWGDQGRVQALLSGIEAEQDPGRRRVLRDHICDLGAEAVPALLSAFHNGDHIRRSTVSWTIASLPHAAQVLVVDHMEELLLQPGASEDLRCGAGLSIVNIRPLGTRAVLHALADADAVGRREAAWALTCLDDPSGLDLSTLATALRDEDDGVRQNAARALMNMNEHAACAVAELAAALADPDSQTRLWAVNALSHIGPAAIPHLVSVVGEANEMTLANIFRRHGSAAVQALVAELDATDDNARRLEVLGVLHLMGADAVEAVPAIHRLTKDEDAEVRWYAGAALGSIQKDRRGDR